MKQFGTVNNQQLRKPSNTGKANWFAIRISLFQKLKQ